MGMAQSMAAFGNGRLSAAVWLLLVAVTRAQAPRTQSIIYARLEDPAGNPVAGATGWLRQEPPRELRALPAATARIGEGLAAPWPTATSDDRGLLRFGGAEWQPGAGSGLVTTPQGLGAVLPRVEPDPIGERSDKSNCFRIVDGRSR